MTGTKRDVLVLQPRDDRLLRELATLRVIDREQATRVGPFGSTTRANTRLLALTTHGLLTRQAVGTVAGGHKYLYALTASGARRVDVPYRGTPWTRDALLAGSVGLEHQLRVNAVYLLLTHESIPVPGVRVRHWRNFTHPLSPAVRLIPDGYVELEGPSGTRAFFLEVDRGTESRRTWIGKAREYLRFAVSGAFTTQFGHGQFGVLVIAPSTRRVHSLRAAVAGVTTKLFWFGSFEVLRADTFWTPIWWRPSGTERHPLMPLPCAIAPTAGT